MKRLQTGQFHGETNRRIWLNGLVLTDTEYTHERVDWHYHEQAYFTFILEGKVLEGNKKEEYVCSPGSLLFHYWQEPHYNFKPPGFTRGFHVEIENRWLQQVNLDLDSIAGSVSILDPHIRLLFYKIFKESQVGDETTQIATESLVLEAISAMHPRQQQNRTNRPAWVRIIREILHDSFTDKISLSTLADQLNIHPVHLSRDFPKYFQCTLGNYIRKLKIQHALSLMVDQKRSLTAIAFDCGFADQSHFNRCFRELMGVSPFAYRKLIIH